MNEGFWRSGDDGRPMYTEAFGVCVNEPWDKQNTYRDEFIGQMMDTVEDFIEDWMVDAVVDFVEDSIEQNADYYGYVETSALDWVAIRNGLDEAILIGEHYDKLAQGFSDLLKTWEINL